MFMPEAPTMLISGVLTRSTLPFRIRQAVRVVVMSRCHNSEGQADSCYGINYSAPDINGLLNTGCFVVRVAALERARRCFGRLQFGLFVRDAWRVFSWTILLNLLADGGSSLPHVALVVFASLMITPALNLQAWLSSTMIQRHCFLLHLAVASSEGVTNTERAGVCACSLFPQLPLPP
jgi:hypothetical protein